MEYLNIDRKEDYVIVQMNRPKVNAINAQMVDEIRTTFKNLDKDDSVKIAVAGLCFDLPGEKATSVLKELLKNNPIYLRYYLF